MLPFYHVIWSTVAFEAKEHIILSRKVLTLIAVKMEGFYKFPVQISTFVLVGQTYKSHSCFTHNMPVYMFLEPAIFYIFKPRVENILLFF